MRVAVHIYMKNCRLLGMFSCLATGVNLAPRPGGGIIPPTIVVLDHGTIGNDAHSRDVIHVTFGKRVKLRNRHILTFIMHERASPWCDARTKMQKIAINVSLHVYMPYTTKI